MSLKQLLTENIGAKVMAALLALLVWYYLHLQSTDTTVLMANIEIESLPQLISRVENIDGDLITQVRVTLKHPKGAKSDIPANLVCRHKLTSVNPEQLHQIFAEEKISARDFNLPPSIKTVKVDPSQVRIILYKEGSKYMRLKTDNCLHGAPKDGYRVVSIKTDASEVLVKGPQHILNKYDSIAVAKIDITGRDAPFSRKGQVEPVLNDAKITVNGEFNIEINIQEKPDEKTFQVPVRLLLPADFPYQVQLKSKERGVKVRGPMSSTKILKVEHLNLFVNVAELYHNIADIHPPMSFSASLDQKSLEFKLASDAPRDIELADSIEPVTLDIITTPEPPKPPETPKQPEPPKVSEPPKVPEPPK